MMELIAKLIFVAVAFTAVGVVVQLLARVYRLLAPPRPYPPHPMTARKTGSQSSSAETPVAMRPDAG